MERGTKVAEGFSQNLILAMYDTDLLRKITNSNYEGEITKVGSRLNIMDFARVQEHDYTKGAVVTPDSIEENNGQLIIEKFKRFYWASYDYDNFISYIKSPEDAIFQQTAGERNRNKDIYVLGKYGDVGAGNRVGVSATAGTVTVTTSTGAVAGSGTAFTAAMVGRGFKAEGHTKWYRVKSYASATSIVIEDDLDDEDSAYTGGAIAGGATYEVEAVTPIALTTSNFLQYIGYLKTKLDTAERYGFNAVPDTDRWIVVPSEFEDICTRASGVELHVDAAYQELVKLGAIGQIKGFTVYKSNRLTGNNTDGFHILAGHSGWMTYAEKIITARMEEDIKGDFGVAYKDLFAYGAKVKDSNRHMAAELFATFTV